MPDQHNLNLSELAETVVRLSEALAASERRHAAIARTMRWRALAVVVILCAGFYATSDWMKAYASQLVAPGYLGQMEQQMAASPPPLGGILQTLGGSDGMEGALVKVLQSASMIAMMESGQPGQPGQQSFLECLRERDANPGSEKLCYAQTAVQDLGEYFVGTDGRPITPPASNASPDEQAQYAQQLMSATLMAGGQAVVDIAALVHRLRRDSDRFRSLISEQPISETLQDISRELGDLNRTLSAVPVMAGQMDVMNRHMATMSYSMGSTMGRMGDIMPW